MPSTEHAHSKDRTRPQNRLPKSAARNLNAAQRQTDPATLIQHVEFDSGRLTPLNVLQLQRAFGNQAVERMITGQPQPSPSSAVQQLDVTFQYRAVPPEAIKKFPHPMGETELTYVPARPSLRLVTIDCQSTVCVEGINASYNAEQNDSMGASAGRIWYGMAAKLDGQWSGSPEALFYIQSSKLKWASGKPPEGVYKFYLHITEKDAKEIEAFEREHLNDFAWAWDLTLGKMKKLVAEFPWVTAEADESLIAQFVDYLIAREARWLIPQHPKLLESWGQHLTTQFANLAGKSKDRDKQGQHSPSGYRAEFSTTEKAIDLYFIMGKHQPSSNYIKAEDLDTPFTAASYRAYKAAAEARADLAQPNRAVTVTEHIPIDVYEKPDSQSTCFADQPAVREGLKEAIVDHTQDETQVWLRIPAKGDLKYAFTTWAYVLVAKADLKSR